MVWAIFSQHMHQHFVKKKLFNFTFHFSGIFDFDRFVYLGTPCRVIDMRISNIFYYFYTSSKVRIIAQQGNDNNGCLILISV